MRRLVRVSLVTILGCVASSVVHADPYTFYKVQNDLNADVTFTHFESPREACESVDGAFWKVGEYAKKAQYVIATNQCVVRMDSNNVLVGAVLSAAGSCAGDVNFSYRQQACVDDVTDQQQHALSLAGYLWLCLIGGMLCGFRAAQ